MSLMDYIHSDDREASKPAQEPGVPEQDTANAAGPKKPSCLWYIPHVPFGFASGPICHYMWESANESEAERHLGHGILLSAGTWIAVGVALLVSSA